MLNSKQLKNELEISTVCNFGDLAGARAACMPACSFVHTWICKCLFSVLIDQRLHIHVFTLSLHVYSFKRILIGWNPLVKSKKVFWSKQIDLDKPYSYFRTVFVHCVTRVLYVCVCVRCVCVKIYNSEI